MVQRKLVDDRMDRRQHGSHPRSALLGVRLAGRRTLAQISAFDAIVTIAIGTLVSSTAVSSTRTYLEGVTALTAR